MRTFKKTHPWISFAFDLSRAKPHLWLLLGEAASKCEHVANVPLRPETFQTLYQVYLAKGAAATTAIEGNSLTETQVQQHIAGKLKLPPSQEYLAQEIDNIVKAFNEIKINIQNGNPTLTPEKISEYNRLVLEKLKIEDDVIAGELRKHSVLVGQIYRGAPPEDCEWLLSKMCEWLEGEDFLPPPGLKTVYAIIKAIVAHLYLEWIHPFGDGNGRTGRLLEFHILLAAGIPAPSAHILSNHYNQTRSEYYRQLDAASKSGGDIIPFLEYAVRGFVDGLKEQINVIHTQQWDVVWRNFVHETFRDNNSKGAQRQKRLLLDLGSITTPIPVNLITELTPRLAKIYATLNIKTLKRDLITLEQLGLIENRSGNIRAKREIILAFLPWRNQHNP